jgi:hypothetical protein
VPADDQAMVLPCTSVMVTTVLLKLAFTWATPDVMFFFSRFLTLPRAALASLAIAIVTPSLSDAEAKIQLVRLDEVRIR